MKSYTKLRNLFGTLTNNSSTSNLALGDQLVNDAIRRICSKKDWPFLETTSTLTTVASQQTYNLPANVEKIINVTVTIGTTQYQPKLAPSRVFWDMLNQTTTVTSNIPDWFYIDGDTIKFYPTPSTSSNTITVTFKKRVVDLSIADYTTGTIATLTNNSASVTGTTTAWTVPMAGRWISISRSNTAAQDGDGLWYQISAVSSATALTLTRPYLGTTLGPAAGASYTIAECSVLPEAYQDLPLWDALEVYFTSVQPEPAKAQLYGRRKKQMEDSMDDDEANKTTDVVVNDYPAPMRNPNHYLTL